MKKIIITFGFFSSLVCWSQVNTEVYRKDITSNGFLGKLATHLDLNTGNQDSIKMGLGGQLQYVFLGINRSKSEPLHHIFLISDNVIAKRDDVIFDNQNFVHLRWTYMWRVTFGSEFFTQYESNDFKKLKIRKIIGTGIRAVLSKGKSYAFYGGSSYIYEYERYQNGVLTRDGEANKNHRWSNYLTLKLGGIDELIQFNLTAYYQPRLNEFEDFRLISDAGLSLFFNKWVSYELNLKIRYSNKPPVGTKQNDYSFKNKLVFSIL